MRSQDAGDPAEAAQYPLSFDKVMRMWRKLVRDQFGEFRRGIKWQQNQGSVNLWIAELPKAVC